MDLFRQKPLLHRAEKLAHPIGGRGYNAMDLRAKFFVNANTDLEGFTHVR